MRPIKYNIARPTKTGEKTYWDNVGEILIFKDERGKSSLRVKIPAIGLDCPAFLVEAKDYSNRPAPQGSTIEQEAAQELPSVGLDEPMPEEPGINAEDLPL